jgi:phospholipid/cholesterol/gamma-HCH transport system ATP-binding protein
MVNNAIEINGLGFNRGDKTILEDINIKIPEGSMVAIMGPSGVGKTTLLQLITGQLMPKTGSIEVYGECVSTMRHRDLYKFRSNLGVLLQNGALFTDLSVYENVAIPLREHADLPEVLIRRLVLSKLHSVGLRGAVGLMPSELSGGMARRVALARAVVLDPKLVLYDEPLTGLDPITVSTLIRLMRDTNDTLNMTSLIVTHDVDEMQKLADYCYIMAGSRVVGEGTPEQLLCDENESVKQFVNGLVDGPVPFHYEAPELQSDYLGQG